MYNSYSAYTCADICAKLSGYDDSCDSSAYDVTRNDILTKVYPETIKLEDCNCDFTLGECDGGLSVLSNICPLLPYYLTIKML